MLKISDIFFFCRHVDLNPLCIHSFVGVNIDVTLLLSHAKVPELPFLLCLFIIVHMRKNREHLDVVWG